MWDGWRNDSTVLLILRTNINCCDCTQLYCSIFIRHCHLLLHCVRSRSVSLFDSLNCVLHCPSTSLLPTQCLLALGHGSRQYDGSDWNRAIGCSVAGCDHRTSSQPWSGCIRSLIPATRLSCFINCDAIIRIHGSIGYHGGNECDHLIRLRRC